jgi:hypothetical protein
LREAAMIDRLDVVVKVIQILYSSCLSS